MLLVVVVVAGCGPAAPRPIERPVASPTPEPTLALGLILHLEDDSGPDGAQRYEAAKLAVELVNRRGGVALPTGERRTLRLVVYDDSGQPEMAEATFRRLIEDGVVAVVGPSSSESSVVVRRAAETARLPLVTLDDEGGGEAATGRWSFSVTAPPGQALAAVVDFFTASGV